MGMASMPPPAPVPWVTAQEQFATNLARAGQTNPMREPLSVGPEKPKRERKKTTEMTDTPSIDQIRAVMSMAPEKRAKLRKGEWPLVAKA